VAPSWFELLAWAAVGLGFASALVIVADIFVLGNRQHMAIMDLAFPLTALYMGPIALWAYFARGRRMSRKRMHMHMAGMEEGPRDSLWQVSLSDSHCGAGCVLGDIAGEWIVWTTAWMIGSTRSCSALSRVMSASATHQRMIFSTIWKPTCITPVTDRQMRSSATIFANYSVKAFRPPLLIRAGEAL